MIKRNRSRDRWGDSDEIIFIQNLNPSYLQGYIDGMKNRAINDGVSITKCVMIAQHRLNKLKDALND